MVLLPARSQAFVDAGRTGSGVEVIEHRCPEIRPAKYAFDLESSNLDRSVLHRGSLPCPPEDIGRALTKLGH